MVDVIKVFFRKPKPQPQHFIIVFPDEHGKGASVSSSSATPLVTQSSDGYSLAEWRQDGMTSIETSGVAEQSGVAGTRIQVRLLRRDLDGQDVERHVSGVVDGVGSVELQ